jgi:hypothetical protein
METILSDSTMSAGPTEDHNHPELIPDAPESIFTVAELPAYLRTCLLKPIRCNKQRDDDIAAFRN